MEGALSVLRETIREDDEELAEREVRGLRRLQNRHWVGPRFALDEAPAVDPARAMSTGATPVRAGLSRFGRAIGHLVGGRDYYDRMRTVAYAREVLEHAEVLKRDWNRLVDRAAEEGVHVIYTDGYDHLHKELDTVSKDMLLERGVKSEISAVLAQVGKVASNRKYFDSCREFMAGRLDRREALVTEAAERGVAVPGHEDYDTWRDVTDFAAGRCEGLMDDPGNYGIHLDCIALRGESLESALARVRQVLEEDDRHLAATLAGQREGERHPVARGARRPSARRSGEASGVAATACRAQGRGAAAEQGPALEHANLVRQYLAGDEISVAVVHRTTEISEPVISDRFINPRPCWWRRTRRKYARRVDERRTHPQRNPACRRPWRCRRRPLPRSPCR